jgi:hypothetical protein
MSNPETPPQDAMHCGIFKDKLTKYKNAQELMQDIDPSTLACIKEFCGHTSKQIVPEINKEASQA